MVWDLLGGITAAVAVAGVVLFLRRVLRLPLPTWTVPAAAGAAMIAFAIWSEYSWFDRMTAALPPSAEVALANADRAPWRPWSYVRPITNRFVAFDRAALATHPAAPGQKLAVLHFYGRWQNTPPPVPVLFDCAGARQAVLADGAAFGPGGTIAAADWQPAVADDPVLAKVCAER